MAIIEVKNLTKEYKLGQLGSIKDTLLDIFGWVRGRKSSQKEAFKALDDISFSIEAGEIVGIIGQNGAGKSTLLKHLAGITTPTSGELHVGGSVAPLIEVGAGLHPELTGRENIYLNGSILGIKKEAIRGKIDDIVSFAELENFIDTPVKRYSSGMRVRLGFSIATSFEADILIIDEVLAVGDLSFQRKCFSRLEQMIKSKDMTVLLVSHNIRQVSRLCSRTILLDNGKIIADGNPSEICNRFYEESNKRVLTYANSRKNFVSNVRSSGELDLLDVSILDEKGFPTDSIPSGGQLRVSVRFLLHDDVKQPEIVVGTHTTDFLYLTTSSTSIFAERPSFEKGEHEIQCVIPSYPLVTGTYCIRFVIRDHHGRGIFNGETLKLFSVLPAKNDSVNESVQHRLINTPSRWSLKGQIYEEETV